MSTSVCCYEAALQSGALHSLAPGFPWPNLAVPYQGLFSISTFALSLLLVFRTNSSYERWWEACSAWNGIVTGCCHLGRQALQWLPADDADGAAARSALLRWLRAFPLCLMCHGREEHSRLPQLLEGVLLPEEQDLVRSSRLPPQLVLSMLGALISGAALRAEDKARMDDGIRGLQASFDCCEKVIRTPLPLSYSRHTSRFLVTWLTFLPFCTWQELGWATIPVTLMMGFFLLGIEEIGVQVEEPLSILALEYWSSVVGQRIQQMEDEDEAVHQMARRKPQPRTQTQTQRRTQPRRPPPPPPQPHGGHWAAPAGGNGGGGPVFCM